MNKEPTTVIVTNLPGPPPMTVMNGTLVKHLSLWCPHISRTGIFEIVFVIIYIHFLYTLT